MTDRLTTADRSLINRARALATVRGDEGIAIVTGSSDPDVAFGYAQHLLASMADLAERLGGGEDQAGDDDVRVAEARRRLAAFPPDTELAAMTPAKLQLHLVRVHGAAQMLNAVIRDGEREAAEDSIRLNAIRQLLRHFDWQRHDRQLALEAVERIVEGGTP